MKLLLIIPPYNIQKRKDNGYLFPVGIAYVNRALRDAGFDVCGLNMNHIDEEHRFAILAEKIVEDKIDCVLCGGLCPDWSIIKKVFDTAKQAHPGIITIGGGGMITSEPIPCAKLLGVDYAVIGEGEITDVELVQALIDNKDVSKIKGIVYRRKPENINRHFRENR